MATQRKYHPGDTVGVYTIIERSKDNATKLICKCNICGSIVDVFISNVNRQKMCRNCRTKYNTKPKTDLCGRKFGRLTVVESVCVDGHTQWRCVCDCGTETIVTTNRLKSGHTQSCGCYMRDRTSEANSGDLIGQKFGRLTVVKRTDGRLVPSGQLMTTYICRCDCGTFISVLASNLVTGNSLSCGCIGSSRGEFTTQEFLASNNVNYTKQHSFPDLRSSRNGVLKFDFALWKEDRLVCLVEYNGEQHYYPPTSKKEFGKMQRDETDGLKQEYCRNRNIKLFELRYYEDLSERLSEVLTYYRNN